MSRGQGSEASPARRRLGGVVLGASLLAATLLILLRPWWLQYWRDESLAAALQKIARPSHGATPCPLATERPLRLLVLGQSNAANHGELIRDDAEPVLPVQSGRDCVQSTDPLPGGTGLGASIWSRLPRELKAAGPTRPIVLSLLAVDATRIDDWSRASSPLTKALDRHLSELRQARWQPDLVLWQQGEADAQAGTSTGDYVTAFDMLLGNLRSAGVNTPVMVANSTYCSSHDPDLARRQQALIRAALLQLQALHADVLRGPDTDLLTGPYRSGPCHFSSAGLDAAARLWSKRIAQVLQATASTLASPPDRSASR